MPESTSYLEVPVSFLSAGRPFKRVYLTSIVSLMSALKCKYCGHNKIAALLSCTRMSINVLTSCVSVKSTETSHVKD